MPRHLIEWDTFDVRVDGERLAALVREQIGSQQGIESLRLRFTNGLLRVDGILRKFIAIPFSVEIRRIEAGGMTIRVPLDRVSAGPLPVPSLLIGLLRDRLPKGLVHYEDPATLVLSMERFLPSFVAVEVRSVWIIDDGLAVTLGKGGADLPPVKNLEDMNG